MKKLLLFALLSSVSAFGQAYSDSVTQNSPGNYGRPVPYASVQVCNIADTATPCTQKVSTFTNDSLGVACTQSAGSGVLTGAPVSGANCNNPGIADANGNFTIYVVSGQYRICTYANNWLCQNVSIGGSGGGIPFACASAVNGSIVGMTSTTTSSCDPNGITDFIGHWTSQSYRATGTFNGTVELIGGLADPTNPPDTNSVAFLAPLTVPTPFYLRPPSSVGAVGQCLGLLSQNIGTNGTIDALQWQSCLANTQVIQVNGTPITTESPANFQAGPNITVTNPSAGNILITGEAGGLPTTTIGTPSAPTLTNQNAAGARSITYLVQGLEDVRGVYHTLTSSTSTIANANASPQVLLSAYGDTLYGPRCFDVYVTADASRAALGLIAHCVGKEFIDTGTTGNGVSATNTNTTFLTINMSPNPGCNIPPNGIIGVDAPDCSPAALSDELNHTFGAPGDANDGFWTQLSGTPSSFSFTGASASWSGGTLILTSGTSGTVLQALSLPLPGTPFTFETYVDSIGYTSGNGCGIGLLESSTGKTSDLILLSNQGPGSTGAGGGFILDVKNLTTNSFAGGEHKFISYWGGAAYLKIQDTGTNLNYFYSNTGDGVGFPTFDTQTVTNAFTTAPDKLLLVAGATGTGAATCVFDFSRRTQ